MKIILLTGNSTRHIAFANRVKMSKKINLLKVFYELGNPLEAKVKNQIENQLLLNHLSQRKQTEYDFFNWFIEFSIKRKLEESYIERGFISSHKFLNEVLDLNPELIIVYGTSIIKGEIIEIFRNKILNLHLGLSPYYRGAGTNYFPFVNNEPEFCGATFMYLDEGVDTGHIIHQIRPLIYPKDSFHQLSNRFLKECFNTYVKLIENFRTLNYLKDEVNHKNSNSNRIYKTKDFTENSLKKLHQNFKSNMIENYLINKKQRDDKVPIIQSNKIHLQK